MDRYVAYDDVPVAISSYRARTLPLEHSKAADSRLFYSRSIILM
jgi:hypothetical protein